MTRPAMLFLIALIALASLAWADDPRPRTINTNGESVVYVAPDEVIVNVGVETFNASLDQAKADNDQLSQRLLKAIKEKGAPDKHIQTANLEIEIRYQDHGHPSLGIEGYFARRAYAVTLKDVKRFEELVDTALKNGANHLMGFEFRTTELRKHRDEARKMAIRAAREKAVALASELGCKVGSPREIHEASFGYLGYTSSHWGWAGSNMMAQNSMQVASEGATGGETLPLGQIGIRATVSVSFDLLPQQ
ncbi:MAG: SIMPL domain-containing protein [Bacillota bacterium]